MAEQEIALGEKVHKGRSVGIGCMVSVVALVVLALLGIPQIMKRLAKVPGGNERASYLYSIYTLQNTYKSQHGVYAKSPGLFEKIGWNKSSLYSYYCDEEVIFCKPDRCNGVPPVLGPDWPFSIRPAAFNNAFLCMAVANVDDDPTWDVWTINEKGESIHVVNDVNE